MKGGIVWGHARPDLTRQEGVSLVEELVAIALVGIILVMVLNALVATILGVGVVDERVTSARLATSALESARVIPFVTDTVAYTPTLPVPGGYAVMVGASTLLTDLQWITATVTHNGRIIWQLESYKVNR